MVERKRWRQLVGPGQGHHLAVILFLPDRPVRLHTHDFPEVFWLERGAARHEINGRTEALGAGDLVFVRPEDTHVLRAVDAAGFTLINLAFAPALRTDLLRRHPEAFGPLFSPDGSAPFRTHLSAGALAGLRRQLPALSGGAPARLALEHFLLGLPLLALPATVARPDRPAMPDWLQRACDEIQRPELFAQGAPGLVRAAGRSAEHVARTVRAILDCTPSAVVNHVRMAHAARELRVTDRPITDIALECGLANLSHFYALFRTAHGRTPRAYRREHQRTVA